MGLGLEGFGRGVGVVEGYFGGGNAGVDGLHFFLELYIEQHCLVLLNLYVYPRLDEGFVDCIGA